MKKYKWVEDKRYIGHGMFWDRGRLVEEDDTDDNKYNYKGYEGEDTKTWACILYISFLLIYVLGMYYLISLACDVV